LFALGSEVGVGISVPTEEQDPFDFDVPFSQQSGDWIRDSQCVCKGICEGDDYMVWLEGFEAIEERSHGREESSGALDSYATGRFFVSKACETASLKFGESEERWDWNSSDSVACRLVSKVVSIP
jgi:hypothetical protein